MSVADFIGWLGAAILVIVGLILVLEWISRP
jgi:hypothetical protein